MDNIEYSNLAYYEEPDGQYSLVNSNDIRHDTSSPISVRKLNILIQKIGTANIMSEKILMLALATLKEIHKEDLTEDELKQTVKIYDKMYTDFSHGYISRFKIQDYVKIMDAKSSALRNEFDYQMNENNFANSWSIMYKDQEGIGKTNMVIGTYYDRSSGNVLIKWNPDVARRIENGANTTMLSLKAISRFSSIYSWYLYQLLKSELCYYEWIDDTCGRPKKGEYVTEFGFDELKLLTSVVQIDMSKPEAFVSEIQNLLNKGEYKEAIGKIRESERKEQDIYGTNIRSGKAFDSWREFRRSVIMKTSKTVNLFEECEFSDENEKEYEDLCKTHHGMDIHFRFEPIRKGIGGAVSRIRFYVRWDKVNSTLIENRREDEDDLLGKGASLDNLSEEQMRMLHEIDDMLYQKVGINTLITIAQKADWNMTRVRNAYAAVLEYKRSHVIRNLGAMMRTAVEKWSLDNISAETGIKAREDVASEIRQRFSEILSHPGATDYENDINEIYDIMSDTICFAGDYVCIGHTDIEKDKLIAKYQELEPEDIICTINQIREAEKGGTDIKNRHSYINTVLYSIHEYRLRKEKRAEERKEDEAKNEVISMIDGLVATYQEILAIQDSDRRKIRATMCDYFIEKLNERGIDAMDILYKLGYSVEASEKAFLQRNQAV